MFLTDHFNYFLKELRIAMKSNLRSHIISIVCITLAFTVLGLILTLWWTADYMTDYVDAEGEINLFFQERLTQEDIDQLKQKALGLNHVKRVSLIEQEEAQARMHHLLGDEEMLTTYFESSPFSAYLELEVSLDAIDETVAELQTFDGIEHVRSNQELLEQVKSISMSVLWLGLFFLLLTGITTMVITSQIIRLSIITRKEEIHTLRLLGASEPFIAIPFLMEGIFVSGTGGILSVGLLNLVIPQLFALFHTILPFIPLPPQSAILLTASLSWIVLSALLGLLGSALPLLNKQNL